ncbi:MAG: leucyl/phenylalanyl-tRNA--protein transferase, partial [Pseudomonadota bacterium]|nr:leucyl/phenylalanyl-tRNA--protein transferase [Pseudomonadota bacterium]
MHAPAAPPPIDPALLLLAYRGGIFPMADARDDPEIFWVEPRRRAVLPLERFHCSHSLAKTLSRGTFEITCNQAFAAVIEACAGPRRDGDETWISSRIARSYVGLHEQGLAHSIECWGDGALLGGLYGVGFDRVFCGESMFSRATDASKVALAWLVAALRRAEIELLDCQFMTGHLASLGAEEMSQADYLELLRVAQRPMGEADGEALGLAAGAGEAAVDRGGLAVGAGLPAGFAALLGDAAAA